MIKEDLIYYLWQTKKLHNLQTLTGENISIIDYGIRNTASGPDFLNARIIIDNIMWVGSVEMHTYSSDWVQHQHQKDPAYENVILHVVHTHDKDILFSKDKKQHIPTTEIKNFINPIVMKNYETLQTSASWIPCEKHLNEALITALKMNLPSLAIEKLHLKMGQIEKIFVDTDFDFAETLYRLLAHYMGGPINGPAFELLAERLPFSLVQKNKYDAFRIQAMFFGVSSLYANSRDDDDYINRLKTEYAFQKSKYSFYEMELANWKFGGMMPSGQPSFRLAQFIALMMGTENILDEVLNAETLEGLKSFLGVKADAYWENHYQFSKSVSPHKTTISRELQERVIINAFIPFIFFYGFHKNDQSFKDRALEMLDDVPSEKNQILNNWKDLGVASDSALDSQALLHLKKNFCNAKACLKCVVGNKIVSI